MIEQDETAVISLEVQYPYRQTPLLPLASSSPQESVPLVGISLMITQAFDKPDICIMRLMPISA